MPLRNFEDSRGQACTVWNVTPFAVQGAERRMVERRVSTGVVYSGPERRTSRDRRLRSPGLMMPGLGSGWLCFERGEEKRRLSPIPAGWEAAPDAELEELFDQARPVPRRSLALS
ncbi:MAG TPA: hypothetical protein VF647_03775 [Longimicrobium sp.]|jgi:hypothetical protein